MLRAYSHINAKYILNTSKISAVHGFRNFKEKDMPICEDCKIVKSRRVSFKPIGKSRSNTHLERIHSDVCGFPLAKSNEGARYFVSLIDDYCKKVIVYPLKQKSEVFESFKRFQERAERFLNGRIANFMSDNGREFVSETFSKNLEDQGIHHELSNMYALEQKGTTENFKCVVLIAIKSFT